MDYIAVISGLTWQTIESVQWPIVKAKPLSSAEMVPAANDIWRQPVRIKAQATILEQKTTDLKKTESIRKGHQES